MKTIVNILVAAITVMLATACALLAPVTVDGKARRAAAIVLETHAALQQAALIYGQLPDCAEPPLVHMCRDPGHWIAIREAERHATDAIVAAVPVLEGSAPDSGQTLRALEAIDAFARALGQGRMRDGEGRP